MSNDTIPLFETHKVCNICRESLLFTAFARRKTGNCVMKPYCKACDAARSHAYREANREAVNLAARKRYEENPDKARAYAREYHKLNLETRMRQQREFRARTIETRLAYSRAYYRAHSDVFKEAARARKQKIRGATVVPFTSGQLLDRLSMFGGKCWMCKCPLTRKNQHIDHVKPISKGGPHMLANLRPACASCNLSKGDRWPILPGWQPPDIAGALGC